MITERASGILLHPTSLPGPYGMGDFGIDAFNFVDWLAHAGQTLWQVLPMGAIGEGNSPYMGSSAFAGSPLLIDPVDLGQHGWLSPDELVPPPTAALDRVDYPQQFKFRLTLLRRAGKAFFAGGDGRVVADYRQFCAEEAVWLEDYALFMALDQAYPAKAWNEWPAALAQRQADALRLAADQYATEMNFWKFCQWRFARQWQRLKAHANAKGVRIVGDVPIFVAYHSADVWANQALFKLDAKGEQTVVAGVPPDYFSATGQRWGNPLFNWPAHQKDGFAWWQARMRRALALADVVRIDHFRGFAAYWEIPAAEASAVNGRWVPAPGRALFEALRSAIPTLPIIAEDLGVITPDVEALRDDFGLPGMRILQFAFSEDASHAYLPHNYLANTVAYTGTHDNNTAIGWWQSAGSTERVFTQHYLGSDGHAIHWDMIRAVSASVAAWAIYPLQDVLELDGRYRMNVPGVRDGNWEWRFHWDQVKPWHADTLRHLSAAHGRCSFSRLNLNH